MKFKDLFDEKTDYVVVKNEYQYNNLESYVDVKKITEPIEDLNAFKDYFMYTKQKGLKCLIISNVAIFELFNKKLQYYGNFYISFLNIDKTSPEFLYYAFLALKTDSSLLTRIYFDEYRKLPEKYKNKLLKDIKKDEND